MGGGVPCAGGRGNQPYSDKEEGESFRGKK